MIIDVHVHFGDWFFPIESAGVASILRFMKKYGIEKSIISSSLGVVYDFMEGNKSLAEAIEGYDNLLGYVTVNPNYQEESSEEMRKYLAQKNFVGVKMHPSYVGQPFTSEESIALMKTVEGLNVPLLLHTYGESAYQAAEVAKKCPNLKIIMGHMGGDVWQASIRVAEEAENLFLEPCCSYPESDKIREAVDAVGAERIVFGSDSTLIEPVYVIGMIEDADISKKEKEMIFYKNAKKLFKI